MQAGKQAGTQTGIVNVLHAQGRRTSSLIEVFTVFAFSFKLKIPQETTGHLAYSLVEKLRCPSQRLLIESWRMLKAVISGRGKINTVELMTSFSNMVLVIDVGAVFGS